MLDVQSGSEPPTASTRMIQAAAELLRAGGIDAVSTTAVATAAGVQPPVLYRQFGNKNGLLDAVASSVFDEYLQQKRSLIAVLADPLHDLEMLWDLHVEFGLTNPYCYVLGYVQPGQTRASARGAKTLQLLLQVVARLAEQGRLGMSVERAADLVHSAALGVVVTLIPVRPVERDLRMSHVAREIALSAIIQDEGRAVGVDSIACLIQRPCRSTPGTAEGNS